MLDKYRLYWYDDGCEVNDDDDNEDESEFNQFEDLFNGCWNAF